VALRIKSRWHGEAERSVAEIAGALGFIAWRLAKDRAINLHGQDFSYGNDDQRFAVIAEYLIYQIQIADRLAHRILDQNQRRELITALVLRAAEHMQENSEDIFGPGDYGKPFIQRFNHQADEYADLPFGDEGPGYSFVRHLGSTVQSIMGDEKQNRWIIDQVMDEDGPLVAKQVIKAFNDLFS